MQLQSKLDEQLKFFFGGCFKFCGDMIWPGFEDKFTNSQNQAYALVPF